MYTRIALYVCMYFIDCYLVDLIFIIYLPETEEVIIHPTYDTNKFNFYFSEEYTVAANLDICISIVIL